MDHKQTLVDRRISLQKIYNSLVKLFITLLPSRDDIWKCIKLLLQIVFGGILLYPLTSRMPMLGWDWYFFFNANHPTDNIFSIHSPFLPFTKYFIQLITWMDWRSSLAFLGGMTFMAIALGTWQNGGRVGSILMALSTPLPLFLMWVGHPDGLALIGLITGFIPLALVKPQITFWAFLRSKATIFWLGVTLLATLVIWPYWFGSVSGSSWSHPAAIGWHALGWPLLVVGLVLILGAGSNPWKLMAAGCFITPDLMPYHMVVLLPAIGCVRGRAKVIVWFAAWLVVLGMGLANHYRYLSLIFPLSIYFSLQTLDGYKQTIHSHYCFVHRILVVIKKPLADDSSDL